jgi:hypothetical protein
MAKFVACDTHSWPSTAEMLRFLVVFLSPYKLQGSTYNYTDFFFPSRSFPTHPTILGYAIRHIGSTAKTR